MKSIRLHAFGPPENLRYEPVGDPHPGRGQVRVAVAASGVHLVDTALRRGEPSGPLPLPALPAIPGREVAGRVDAVGADVDRAWLGRRVVTHLGPAGGGYAELAVRDVDAVHALPAAVPYASAVAMIGTGRTAFGVLEVADVRPDDVVLVTAAAGGLGSLLVQAISGLGATVVAVAAGGRKVEHARRQGAHAAVDYAGADWSVRVRDVLGGRDVSVVLDGVGGSAGRTALELLGVGGRMVVFGWSSGQPTPLTEADLSARGLTASFAIGPRMVQRPGGIRGLEERALAALADGSLEPPTTRFPLAEAARAHAAVERRQTLGKTVLDAVA